jgi:hypothetical protein
MYTHTHTHIENDSKLLSGFSLIDHGNPDSNLESNCYYVYKHNKFSRNLASTNRIGVKAII